MKINIILGIIMLLILLKMDNQYKQELDRHYAFNVYVMQKLFNSVAKSKKWLEDPKKK